jgi:hypothetical protein
MLQEEIQLVSNVSLVPLLISLGFVLQYKTRCERFPSLPHLKTRIKFNSVKHSTELLHEGRERATFNQRQISVQIYLRHNRTFTKHIKAVNCG